MASKKSVGARSRARNGSNDASAPATPDPKSDPRDTESNESETVSRLLAELEASQRETIAGLLAELESSETHARQASEADRLVREEGERRREKMSPFELLREQMPMLAKVRTQRAGALPLRVRFPGENEQSPEDRLSGKQIALPAGYAEQLANPSLPISDVPEWREGVLRDLGELASRVTVGARQLNESRPGDPFLKQLHALAEILTEVHRAHETGSLRPLTDMAAVARRTLPHGVPNIDTTQQQALDAFARIVVDAVAEIDENESLRSVRHAVARAFRALLLPEVILLPLVRELESQHPEHFDPALLDVSERGPLSTIAKKWRSALAGCDDRSELSPSLARTMLRDLGAKESTVKEVGRNAVKAGPSTARKPN
jgi:hypothetical protein